MEKQGFRFIILRVLAHRLQYLADFVSRQVVEEERPVLWEQANPESAGTGSVIDASRVVSSPESELAGSREVDQRQTTNDHRPTYFCGAGAGLAGAAGCELPVAGFSPCKTEFELVPLRDAMM